mmetsp:Transcript_9942/g.14650  ORF Transcript_9942/g.14650 Transcript_9942/m.14650 type:complete len:112 (+) Transcript_9942:16-351(+)
MPGVQLSIIKKGDGKNFPQSGNLVSVHYIGYVDKDGSEIEWDSTRKRNRPFTFKMGVGEVIPGWEEAVAQMSIGQRAKVTMPPELAYGEKGFGLIKPNTSISFDVELVSVE